MPILPQPSVSPLHSFASLPPAVRQASFSETLAILWRWLRGVQPGWRDRVREAQLIEKLSEELGDEPEPVEIMEADRLAGKLAKGTRGSKVKGARGLSGPTLDPKASTSISPTGPPPSPIIPHFCGMVRPRPILQNCRIARPPRPSANMGRRVQTEPPIDVSFIRQSFTVGDGGELQRRVAVTNSAEDPVYDNGGSALRVRLTFAGKRRTMDACRDRVGDSPSHLPARRSSDHRSAERFPVGQPALRSTSRTQAPR